ncbi:hypothetical protein Poly51_45880 [Rubripirellula tenax]|uniref:Lipoprotein chaperone n=1 Tax=Rubripirellula tenax TaxID=2528015 RepID=A0A5C6EKQ5_9BACT|nr:hypothetical protein [Rubripirellula tenax]TWU48687.1 hypothetical protein Poly51_45880 [Rubripirellula tenax]
MNAVSNRSIFVVVSSTIFSIGCDLPRVASDPKATQAIEQMAKAYSDCQSYSDSGTVTTVFHSDKEDRTVVKHFSTAMIRPSKFRFEFNEQDDPDSRYIIWQDGGDVLTWWDLKKRSEREDSLGMAIAGATGVSSGSAHTVPAMLMPAEIGGRLITALKSAQLGASESLGEHACLTIKASYGGDPITIWIDEQSHLIRRIDTTSVFDDFTTSETTIYDPVVDDEIEPNRLAYDAPE